MEVISITDAQEQERENCLIIFKDRHYEEARKSYYSYYGEIFITESGMYAYRMKPVGGGEYIRIIEHNYISSNMDGTCSVSVTVRTSPADNIETIVRYDPDKVAIPVVLNLWQDYKDKDNTY